MSILGSETENVENGLVSQGGPDEAAKPLDSFPGTISGTVGHSDKTVKPVSSL